MYFEKKKIVSTLRDSCEMTFGFECLVGVSVCQNEQQQQKLVKRLFRGLQFLIYLAKKI